LLRGMCVQLWVGEVVVVCVLVLVQMCMVLV
jgi:hypothetical protein